MRFGEDLAMGGAPRPRIERLAAEHLAWRGFEIRKLRRVVFHLATHRLRTIPTWPLALLLTLAVA
jgi:hypothetical protein